MQGTIQALWTLIVGFCSFSVGKILLPLLCHCIPRTPLIPHLQELDLIALWFDLEEWCLIMTAVLRGALCSASVFAVRQSKVCSFQRLLALSISLPLVVRWHRPEVLTHADVRHLGALPYVWTGLTGRISIELLLYLNRLNGLNVSLSRAYRHMWHAVGWLSELAVADLVSVDILCADHWTFSKIFLISLRAWLWYKYLGGSWGKLRIAPELLAGRAIRT